LIVDTRKYSFLLKPFTRKWYTENAYPLYDKYSFFIHLWKKVIEWETNFIITSNERVYVFFFNGQSDAIWLN